MTTIVCPGCGELLIPSNDDECFAWAAALTALEQGRDYRDERWTRLRARDDDDDI